MSLPSFIFSSVFAGVFLLLLVVFCSLTAQKLDLFPLYHRTKSVVVVLTVSIAAYCILFCLDNVDSVPCWLTQVGYAITSGVFFAAVLCEAWNTRLVIDRAMRAYENAGRSSPTASNRNGGFWYRYRGVILACILLNCLLLGPAIALVIAGNEPTSQMGPVLSINVCGNTFDIIFAVVGLIFGGILLAVYKISKDAGLPDSIGLVSATMHVAVVWLFLATCYLAWAVLFFALANEPMAGATFDTFRPQIFWAAAMVCSYYIIVFRLTIRVGVAAAKGKKRGSGKRRDADRRALMCNKVIRHIRMHGRSPDGDGALSAGDQQPTYELSTTREEDVSVTTTTADESSLTMQDLEFVSIFENKERFKLFKHFLLGELNIATLLYFERLSRCLRELAEKNPAVLDSSGGVSPSDKPLAEGKEVDPAALDQAKALFAPFSVIDVRLSERITVEAQQMLAGEAPLPTCHAVYVLIYECCSEIVGSWRNTEFVRFSRTKKKPSAKRKSSSHKGSSNKTNSAAILVVCSKFPVISQTFVINQVVGLLDRGHAVSIYPVWECREYDHPLNRLIVDVTPDTEKQILGGSKFDVVIAQFGYHGVTMMEARRKYSCSWKLVSFFRGMEFKKLQDNPQMFDDLVVQGDLFCGTCENFRQRVISLGADASRVKVVYSSVDCSLFAHSSERTFPHCAGSVIRLITVARLVPKKGLEYALAAVHKWIAENSTKEVPIQVQYTIVGPSIEAHCGYEARVRSQVKELQLEKVVQFVGPKTSEQIKELLLSSDIFICPSVTASSGDVDSMPNVIKEALLCRTPVIATSVSGIPEMIEHEVSGLLVPEKDADSIHRSLCSIVSDWEKAKLMGKRGHDRARAMFDIPIQAAVLEKHLVALISSQTN